MAPTEGTPGYRVPSRAEPGCWGSVAWCRELHQAGRECPSCQSTTVRPSSGILPLGGMFLENGERTMNPRFEALTPDTATGRAADLLADIIDRNGSAGQMVRTMANSPAVLQGYLELSRAMKRSRVDRALSERISLAVQAELGCELCLDAHTEAAIAAGVEPYEIELAKQGTSSVADIAALVAFAQQVHTHPATVTADDLEALRGLGYSDRDLLDVVGLVALNVLTGTFNLVAGLEPLDHPAAA